MSSKKIKIIVFILPNANMLDLSGAAQVFHEAIEQGLDASLEFCSFEDYIKTSTQLPLGRIDSYKKYFPTKGDYIFIGSADIKYILSDKLNPSNDLISWFVKAYNTGVTICALCNGAFLLGKAGLLDNINCTTHWKRTRELQQFFKQALVHENILFTEDRGIITSAGATSGIDVALYVLGKIKGDHFAYKISRELVIYTRRSGSHVQQSIFMNYRNHVHLGIHKVQDWLQQNLHQKVTIPDLAEIAGMSERNFTRVFKKETSLTVNDYITLLRKEKITELLKNPDITRIQIAKQCGLQSERHVSRLIQLDLVG